MKKYVLFEEICLHKSNFYNSKLKLIPGTIYKGGDSGNHSAEVLSKLMGVGNTGGMRSKNINKSNKTAFIVLTITHQNNNWNDYVDYTNKEVVYYGDNQNSSDIHVTKHKGNEKLRFLFDHINNPDEQYPLFLFERDYDCINRDFKYVGLVIPSKEQDGLSVVDEERNGMIIKNYKAKLLLTQDEIDFRWVLDLIDGKKPLESGYCPLEWKQKIQNDNRMDIESLINKGIENWEYELVFENMLEGKKMSIDTTRYERNPKLRKSAIELHGTTCQICGFDFNKVYGELGNGYVEVHHINPLSKLQKEIEINPETDLICVCSNCHRMLHRRKDTIMKINDIKKILNKKI